MKARSVFIASPVLLSQSAGSQKTDIVDTDSIMMGKIMLKTKKKGLRRNIT